MNATTVPASPVPSGTVVLLRDGMAGLEMFMVIRHHQIDFASGALVFPGGKVAPMDTDSALTGFCDGADADPVMRAIQIGAIREAFEEAGLLLARPAGSEQLIDGERTLALHKDRDHLHSGKQTLLEFLAREKLRLACDLLTRFAHWVTPEMMPKRFDTHFFIATAPEDQTLIHDGQESTSSVWITPAQAIADASTGKHTVLFPTLCNIELIGQARTVTEALEQASAHKIITVMPWTEKRDDGVWLRIPENAGYLTSATRMPSANSQRQTGPGSGEESAHQ